jgi:DNA-binding MarR family transcriptional regulator
MARSPRQKPEPELVPADPATPEPTLKAGLEQFVPYKLSVVANRISQSIGHLFEEKFDIQIPEWRIIMALDMFGDLPFYEIVDRTSMDKARVSRALKRLSDLGLILSRPDPFDGRKVILRITPKGRRMCAAILPDAERMEEYFLSVLSPEERREFDLILDRLLERSQELKRKAASVAAGSPDEPA